MSDVVVALPNITGPQQEALEASVVATFEAIIGSAPRPRVCDQGRRAVSGAVGMISLLGDIGWSVMVVLPPESAVPLAQAFTGFEVEYESDDMGDVVGELVNVLTGDLLARLEAAGTHAQMGLPAVMRGDEIRMMLPDQEPLLHLGYETVHGPFSVVVGARLAG
jgi:chemotaxis protein CheX